MTATERQLELNNLKPIIKCPGGKSRLLTEILSNFPSENSFDTYVEPFVGGGAVFFRTAQLFPHLEFVINDFNPDIINLYNTVKYNHKDLIEILELYYEDCNKPDLFYEIRNDFNSGESSDISPYVLSGGEQSARFLYLNKACYNGLIRYNRKGEFNSPFGRHKNLNLFDEFVFADVARLFNKKHVSMFNQDFSRVIWNVVSESNSPEKVFIYLDPPYDELNLTSSFTSYTSQGFSKADHMRLKRDLDMANDLGARFLLSSSDTEFIRDLFSDYNIVTIKAGRSINSKKEKRGKINELLIRNY